MPDDSTLALQPRTLLGKKVKRLRREGLVPANVYGRGQESVALQGTLVEFRRVYRSVARNSVVNLQIEGESKPRPAVLRHVQRHPVSGDVLHIDFYEIDVSRPIQAAAAIHLAGESEAVAAGGVLVHSLDTVLLEALPLEMPSDLTIDISSIVEFGQSIHVSDLVIPDGVRAITEATAQIVTVLAPRLLDEEEEAAAAGGEELEEGAEPVEGAEGAEGGEGASGGEAASGADAERGRGRSR